MWKKMTEGSTMFVALITTILSFGLAQVFVQVMGWRWTYMVAAPLDASNSILGYTLMLGMILPTIALFGGVIVVAETPKLLARLKRK